MRLSAEHWLQRAEAVWRLAVAERDPEVQQAMLAIAERYNLMAERAAAAEISSGRPPRARDPKEFH